MVGALLASTQIRVKQIRDCILLSFRVCHEILCSSSLRVQGRRRQTATLRLCAKVSPHTLLIAFETSASAVLQSRGYLSHRLYSGSVLTSLYCGPVNPQTRFQTSTDSCCGRCALFATATPLPHSRHGETRKQSAIVWLRSWLFRRSPQRRADDAPIKTSRCFMCGHRSIHKASTFSCS